MQLLPLSLAALASILRVHATEPNPVGKAIELLSQLQQKTISDGEEATKVYQQVADICEDRSKNLANEIKAGKAEMGDLRASIEAETASTASLQTKVEELASTIQTAETQLKAATEVRSKESADFAAQEKELMTAIDAMERASSILENENLKHGASMVQLQNANSITHVMSMLVEASAITLADAKQLSAFLQSSQQSEDGEDEASLAAPDAAIYEGHGKAIVSTIYDLLDKAQAQLSAARKKESEALHNYAMVKQSLQDEIKYTTAELSETKQKIAASSERKAVAQGDLEVAGKELKEDTKGLADLRHDCMSQASDYEVATKDRGELLKALADAKKVVQEKTGGAEKLTYNSLTQVDFLQVSRSGMGAQLQPSGLKAIRVVRELARKQQSTLLAQLAMHMGAAVRSQRLGGGDPFSKVKALVVDMIDRLEKSQDEEATHKAFCDKELAENQAKKEDKTERVEKISTKIDQMASRDAELQAQIVRLQKELSSLINTQAQMDQLRQKEKAEFEKNEVDMTAGITGVKMALKILRDYYEQGTQAGEDSSGAGAGIIGSLEVTESDFSKNLAELSAVEESAQSAYDRETKDNLLEKTAKEQDVKHKTKEVASLEKALSEAANDKSMEQAELDAILESLKLVEKQCVATPSSYEERQSRYQAEVAGLKEALATLEGTDPALVQSGRRLALRGVRPHGTTV